MTYDSGAACVNIDVSNYDRSCQADSDCMAIARVACQACTCAGTAINVHGRDRYNATLAQLPPATKGFCACPDELLSKCVQGVCHEYPGTPW